MLCCVRVYAGILTYISSQENDEKMAAVHGKVKFLFFSWY